MLALQGGRSPTGGASIAKPSCCWWWRWPGASAPVLEPPAVVAGLDDVAVVGDAVEECGGHLGVAEHGGPFAEREVGGDDHRGPLVEFADKMEQQLAARARERQIAEFVEDDEIEPGELGGECAGLANAGLLLEPGDEIDGVEVASTGTGANDAGGDGDGEVGLAGAGRSSFIMPAIMQATRFYATGFIRVLAKWLRLRAAIVTAMMLS